MEATWIFRRARRQADRSRGTLLGVAVAFLALTVSAGGALLGGRLSGEVTGAMADNVHVIAYLRDDMSAERAEALVQLLRRIPGVVEARPVGSDEALARLRAAARSLGTTSSSLDGLEPGFLPRSVEIALAPSERLPAHAAELAGRLRTLPGVAEVDAMADGVARLLSWIRLGRWAAFAVFVLALGAAGAALALAAARGRESRAEEARVLALLGATRWGIRAPATLNIAGAALVGSVIGLVTLYGLFAVAVRTLNGTGGLPSFLGAGEVVAAIVLAAILGCAVGYRATPVPETVDA